MKAYIFWETGEYSSQKKISVGLKSANLPDRSVEEKSLQFIYSIMWESNN